MRLLQYLMEAVYISIVLENALPGGYYHALTSVNPTYPTLGYKARFWTSTNVNMYSWQVTIDYDNTGLNTDYYYNINGFSVRCIKD